MNTNETILMIGETGEHFAAAATLLRNEGYSVSFEPDVRASLEHASEYTPILIISELAAPNIDGLQLCRRLREKPSLAGTRIVLVGDLSEESSIVADGFRSGASGYIQKPIDPSKLADMCRGLLAQKSTEPGPRLVFDRGKTTRREADRGPLRSSESAAKRPTPESNKWKIDRSLICDN